MCRQDLRKEEVVDLVGDETPRSSNLMRGSVVNNLKNECDKPSQTEIQELPRSLCYPLNYTSNRRQKIPRVSRTFLCTITTRNDDCSNERVDKMEDRTFICPKFPAECCMLELC